MKKAVSTRQVLLASVSAVALFIASEARSADLPTKAPIPVKAPIIAPPIFSWTGCYVGGHAGYGWGRNHHTQTTSFSAGSGGTHNAAAVGSVDTSGGLIGGQVGCNYQFASRWVLGIQGDGAWTDLSGRTRDPLAPFVAPFFGLSPGLFSIGVTTQWLASVTGRIGVTAFDNNRALFYLKGGVAFTHDRWDLTHAADPFRPDTVGENRTGYTVGVGVEYLLDPHWSVFGEYNYYAFNGNNLLVSNPSVGLPLTFTSNSQQIQTIKVGVNYLFNLAPAPVVAKY